MIEQRPEFFLTLANQALKEGNPIVAIPLYIRALQFFPILKNSIQVCLQVARRLYWEQRKGMRSSIAVCGWELAHNAAGRAYTLAKIYEEFADVELIGCIFPAWGDNIWEPIRNTSITKNFFIVKSDVNFIDQAMDLVLAHPYDVVHLSKPRAPNIIFGLLYKMIWGTRVIVDIDDEELAIVGCDTAIDIDKYIENHGKFPMLRDLTGKEWTRFAVGMVNHFDGVSVSNPALQQRYGGKIIRHARDEKIFNPTYELKCKSRKKIGISPNSKVVLFLGTPRKHKGLLEAAYAIRALKRKDIEFVIVGNFNDQSFKQKLLEVDGVNFRFLPNQSIDVLPDTVIVGDICMLLQDSESAIAQFQVPAKLTDAIASGVIPIVKYTPALAEFKSSTLVQFCETNEIECVLRHSLEMDSLEFIVKSRSYFQNYLSVSAQLPTVNQLLSLPINPPKNYFEYFLGWMLDNLSTAKYPPVNICCL